MLLVKLQCVSCYPILKFTFLLFFILGLRTLCIAMAEISQEDYDRWSDIYYKASTSLENRDEKVDEAAELIEKVCGRMIYRVM